MWITVSTVEWNGEWSLCLRYLWNLVDNYRYVEWNGLYLLYMCGTLWITVSMSKGMVCFYMCGTLWITVNRIERSVCLCVDNSEKNAMV